jgi:hypothetical protein
VPETRRFEDLASELERLDHQINGNGQEGIRQKLDRLLIAQSRRSGADEVTKEMEQRHHKQNTFRLNMIIGLLTIVAAYLALFKH